MVHGEEKRIFEYGRKIRDNYVQRDCLGSNNGWFYKLEVVEVDFIP